MCEAKTMHDATVHMNCQEAYDKLQEDKVNKSGDTITGTLSFVAPNGHTAGSIVSEEYASGNLSRLTINVGEDSDGTIDIGANSLRIDGLTGDGTIRAANRLTLQAGISSGYDFPIIVKSTDGIEFKNFATNSSLGRISGYLGASPNNMGVNRN